MKTIFCIFLSLAALALGMLSCQKAPELTLTGPASIEVNVEGGSGTISFTANRDWKVSCSDSWVTVSPSSGTAANGTVAVTVRCEANTTYDDRSATVTISMEGLTQSVTVRQPANSGVLVPKSTFDLTSGAQTIEVEVQKNINYTVEIEESCKSWIKKLGTKGLTSEKISFAIAENTSYDARKGTVTIIPFTGPEQKITINQEAQPGIEVAYSKYTVNPEGGSLEISVKTNVEFDVTTNTDWIHYVQTKALSEKTIVLTIDENKTFETREGTIVIKQRNGSLEKTVSIGQYSAAVDLGIVMKREDGSTYNLYWARCDLGATSPTEQGECYAWGEIETKDPYSCSWDNYKWANGAANKLTKYCSARRPDCWDGNGEPDDKTILDPEDDAARAKLGGKWRVPTRDEWAALFEQCTISKGSNYTIIITGKNNNSITLRTLDYWTAQIDYSNPFWARVLSVQLVYYNDSNIFWTSERCNAWFIRPVTE